MRGRRGDLQTMARVSCEPALSSPDTVITVTGRPVVPVDGRPVVTVTGRPVLSGCVGSARFIAFWWISYLIIAGNFFVPFILSGTELVLLYPVVFFIAAVFKAAVFPSTFTYLDLSIAPVGFTLDVERLVLHKPRWLGPCGGCFLLPLPMWSYVTKELRSGRNFVPVSQLRGVHVYQRRVNEVVNAGRVGPQGASPTMQSSVDQSSVVTLDSHGDITSSDLPGCCPDVICQPCYLACGSESEVRSYAHVFLGADTGREVIELSRPTTSTALIADAFRTRDRIRGWLRSGSVSAAA